MIEAWRTKMPFDGERALSHPNGQYHFDLAEANHMQLRAAGVRGEAIERSDICTRCDGSSWFSHRGQGPTTGRFASIITVLE